MYGLSSKKDTTFHTHKNNNNKLRLTQAIWHLAAWSRAYRKVAGKSTNSLYQNGYSLSRLGAKPQRFCGYLPHSHSSHLLPISLFSLTLFVLCLPYCRDHRSYFEILESSTFFCFQATARGIKLLWTDHTSFNDNWNIYLDPHAAFLKLLVLHTSEPDI